jgi:hypothetical protein
MTVVLVVLGRPAPNAVLPPQVLVEFEVLLTRLDLHVITPGEWRRLKTLLVIATLEAGDAEAGMRAYANALAKWRVARHYDHD